MLQLKDKIMPGSLNILFLCTGNSCRSQMAEGWARYLKGEQINAYSAGIAPHGLDPRAVAVMAQAGVDISSHRSKHLDELSGVLFDYVVTVCGHAHEHCPVFPGKAQVVHVPFEDPPQLAKTAATEEQALQCYQRVRDQIKTFVSNLPDSLARE
jgi:arsenate reductase